MAGYRWGKPWWLHLNVVAEIRNTNSQNDVHDKIKIRNSNFEIRNKSEYQMIKIQNKKGLAPFLVLLGLHSSLLFW